jgi:NADPH-dependent curcumin reductase CurA
MSEFKSCAERVTTGSLMAAEVVAEIDQLRHPSNSESELIRSWNGLRSYAAVSASILLSVVSCGIDLPVAAYWRTSYLAGPIS